LHLYFHPKAWLLPLYKYCQGVDAIVFGDGIKISDVSITKDGNDLLLTINTQDSILLKTKPQDQRQHTTP
jgi:hypothetical protein